MREQKSKRTGATDPGGDFPPDPDPGVTVWFIREVGPAGRVIMGPLDSRRDGLEIIRDLGVGDNGRPELEVVGLSLED